MSIQRYIVGYAPNMAPCAKKYDEGDYVLFTDHEAELHNLLSTLADIRAALGVGDRPMLSELAGIVREIREQADRDEKAACKAMEARDAVAARAEKIRKALVDARSERDAVVRERDEAVEVLQWYANYNNYRFLGRHKLPIIVDNGDIARAALTKIKGERNA